MNDFSHMKNKPCVSLADASIYALLQCNNRAHTSYRQTSEALSEHVGLIEAR